MSVPNGSEPTSRGDRVTLLWGGTLVPATAATVILVVGDDVRLLRLGLVAALWAVLAGALGFARFRRRARDEGDRAAERRRVYELELEREIAARREFELEAENAARRRVAEESDSEIQNLRAELNNLREVLKPLVEGDVLYERVALRAESTRVRSLGEAGQQEPAREPAAEGRPLTVAGGHGGSVGDARASSTETFARVQGEVDRSSEQRPEREARPRGAATARSGAQQAGPPRQGRSPVGLRPDSPGSPERPDPIRRPDPGGRGEAPADNGTAAQASPRRPARPDGSQLGDSQPGRSQAGGARPGGSQPGHPPPAERTDQPARYAGSTRSAGFARPDKPAEAPRDSTAEASGTTSQPDIDRSPPADPRARSEPGPGDRDDRRGPQRTEDSGTGSWTSEVAPGAHAEGTSVTDLLAAYGGSGDSRRRRRRDG